MIYLSHSVHNTSQFPNLEIEPYFLFNTQVGGCERNQLNDDDPD